MNSDLLQQHIAAAHEALGLFLGTLLGPDASLHVDAPVPASYKEARLQMRAYVTSLAAAAPCAILLEPSWVPLCATAMLGEPLEITDDGAEDLMRETIAQGYGSIRNHLVSSGVTLPETTFQILEPTTMAAEDTFPDEVVEISFTVKQGTITAGGLVLIVVPTAAEQAPASEKAPAAAPAQPRQVEVSPAAFPDLGSELLVSNGSNDNFNLLAEVELDVTVELGRRKLPLADVLRLTTGSVIELEKLVGEPLEIYANGRLIAEGEAVVIDEQFGIRITGLASRRQRTKAFL